MTTQAPMRNAATQFKPVHDKEALRIGFIAHASQGRTNGEFAELNGLRLRTLQLYIAEWKLSSKIENEVTAKVDQDTQGQDEFSPIAFADKRRALKVYRNAMDGKPTTPTKLKAAEAILKLAEIVTDDRSEFQSWPDSKLGKLLHELNPISGGVETRIIPLSKHSEQAPLYIEGASTQPDTTAQALLATGFPSPVQGEQGSSTGAPITTEPEKRSA